MTELDITDRRTLINPAETASMTILKFGRNTDVDTGEVDIWDADGVWVAPTQARIHAIVSTEAVDTLLGTGARQVLVSGLNASGVVVEEHVALNGATPVITANSYTIIYRMAVEIVGSGGKNAGVITATAATDATVTAQIAISNNQTLMAIFKVPTGYTAYIKRYYASINKAAPTASADIKLWVQNADDVWQLKHVRGVVGAGSSGLDHPFPICMTVSENLTIKLAAIGSAVNMDISAGFDMYLVKD